jgi:hypothetical protein
MQVLFERLLFKECVIIFVCAKKEAIMDVARYTFQTPYPQQVQIGRPDPSVKQEDEQNKQNASLVQNTDQTAQQAQSFQASQTKEVEPSVAPQHELDTYA